VVARYRAEVFDPADAILGEGPAWDARSQQLSWVDVLSSTVYVTGGDGARVTALSVPGHVGAALPSAAGGFLVALPDRLAHLSLTGELTPVAELEAHLPGNRANDAKCDPAGRAWVGTMAYDEAVVAGSLYRVDGPERIEPVLGALGIANGLGWSPDQRTMYFIDTVTHQIRAYPFDLDSGTLGPPQVVAEIDPAEGYPDGMCVDDDGGLWVALFAGAAVRRYTPDGVLDAVVELPVTYTTSCCFGPGDTLFVTTSTRDLDEEGRRREATAGSVFAASVGISGPAATPWAG
jgi:sugar lactone lactonase YvrE